MYLDTSALLKLLVTEAESDLLDDHLDRLSEPSVPLVTSEFTLAELHRNANKHGVDESVTDDLLDQIELVALTTELLRRAGRLPATTGFLRTADALHVATAMTAAETSFCTYDRRQAAAATSFGFRIVAPGRAPGWYA